MHTTHNRTGGRGAASRKLGLARQWAEDIYADRETLSQDTIDAAADIIQSLPDTVVDGDKLREAINDQLSSYPHGTVGHHVAEDIACKLQALLDPPPPTLAEMEPEEAAGYIGKDVQVIDRPDMPPIMLLAVRSGKALVLIEDPLRFWPYTDTWPLDELTPTEPEREQA